MSSESFGTPYEVMERLGKYQPKTFCFKRDKVTYCCTSDNTASVSEDSVVTEKDYGKPSKVVFIRIDRDLENHYESRPAPTKLV